MPAEGDVEAPIGGVFFVVEFEALDVASEVVHAYVGSDGLSGV